MRVRTTMTALLLIAGALAGCSERSRAASIDVDEAPALVDAPLHITLGGLQPGAEVTVETASEDGAKKTWRAHATFTADEQGSVDLDTAAPSKGTYRGADGMGLFWSMVPPQGDPDEQWFIPASVSWTVQLTVRSGGRTIATRELTRELLRFADVAIKPLEKARDGVSGTLYTPVRATGVPVLLFGGSEGGNAMTWVAALLAQRGHPTLSLAYFHDKGLPEAMRNVPLEYFSRAARILSPKAPVAIMGASRGSEAALLAAQHFPTVVRGAVIYAPTDEAGGAYPGRGAAWTLHGKPVPRGPIPVDRLSGPVLAVVGASDTLWPKPPAEYMTRLKARLPTATVLTYPDAGHGVTAFPYTATGIRSIHPISQVTINEGGSRTGQARAKADSWPKVLTFLASL